MSGNLTETWVLVLHYDTRDGINTYVHELERRVMGAAGLEAYDYRPSWVRVEETKRLGFTTVSWAFVTEAAARRGLVALEQSMSCKGEAWWGLQRQVLTTTRLASNLRCPLCGVDRSPGAPCLKGTSSPCTGLACTKVGTWPACCACARFAWAEEEARRERKS